MPITGTNGPDLITGTNGIDDIFGLAGDDTLRGLDGNDTLDGGDGNDILTGGLGVDVLTGGTGANVFLDTAAGFNGDRITDFLPGDRLQFTDLTVANANFNLVGSNLTFNGGSLQIDSIGPGRLVIRPLSSGGVELRLQSAANNDFNGDGRSDILWRANEGTLTDWLGQANGSFVFNPASYTSVVPTSVQVAGTGDFNGDGRVDILWRASGGVLTNWLGQADGSFAYNPASYNSTVPSSVQIVGTGDFNGDGRTDILWRTSGGVLTNFLAQTDGSFAFNPASYTSTVPSSVQIVGTGDFNGDGIDDILWRASDGTLTDWLGRADGSFAFNPASYTSAVPSSVHLIGTGDFNGDGRADIIWRTNNGTITNWLAQPDGSFVFNPASYTTAIPANLHIAAIGDFNGDAIDDILLRGDDGAISDWLGQGNGSFSYNPASFDARVPTSVHIQSPFTHDVFV